MASRPSSTARPLFLFLLHVLIFLSFNNIKRQTLIVQQPFLDSSHSKTQPPHLPTSSLNPKSLLNPKL